MSERDDKIRLFIGVRLSMASVRAIADAATEMRERADEGGLKVRWVSPARYHITLKFLGWTRGPALDPIRDRLARVAGEWRRFEIGVAGAGAFPSPAKARVLWIGVDDRDGKLVELASRIEEEMVGLGFGAEQRAYHPHITLGRVNGTGNAEPVLLPWSEHRFSNTRVGSLVLFESDMKSKGSEYPQVASWHLGGRSGRGERHTASLQRSSERTSTDEPPDTSKE